MSALAEGLPFADALKRSFKAALVSPHFLFRVENDQPDETGAYRISDFELASRLSSFLWSSMPDDELMTLAANDRLRQPEVLRAQVDRMLRDPKSDALVDGFLGSWLGLRELGATPPDRASFREYYHYDLDTAMRRETFLFTRHLIDQNLPLRHFLDARFTFANKRLARLYGVEQPASSGFELVALPKLATVPFWATIRQM